MALCSHSILAALLNSNIDGRMSQDSLSIDMEINTLGNGDCVASFRIGQSIQLKV